MFVQFLKPYIIVTGVYLCIFGRIIGKTAIVWSCFLSCFALSSYLFSLHALEIHSFNLPTDGQSVDIPDFIGERNENAIMFRNYFFWAAGIGIPLGYFMTFQTFQKIGVATVAAWGGLCAACFLNCLFIYLTGQ